MPRRSRFALLALAALTGCMNPGGRLNDSPTHRQLAELQTMMCGDFDNHEQYLSDSRFFLIKLHIVPIWTSRSDGPWLYLEQAAADKADRPYRQRILRVHPRGKDQVECVVFIFRDDPLQHAGAWKNPYVLNSISPDQLRRREGCSVHLTRQPDGGWTGGTSGTGCSSDIRGATYATTEVAVFPDTLRSWDRGFDHDGRQVWGSTLGAYVFRKITSEPPTTEPSSPGAPTGIQPDGMQPR